jgi:hypothetical protein
VVTTGGVAMGMAVLVFGRRRRNEQQTASDAALADAAGRGLGYVPALGAAAMVQPASPMPAAAAAAAATAAVQAAAMPVLAAGDVDAHLPRWRRPSLMEARKNDPVRNAPANAVRLTFKGSAGEAVTGLDRRLVRYRMVSLLSAPDEVTGREIGVLDQGDEVVLLEKRGMYWRVLCPDGSEGWLHKTTLGDTIIGAGTPSETWTAADDGPGSGGFADVLRAYQQAREQHGGQQP